MIADVQTQGQQAAKGRGKKLPENRSKDGSWHRMAAKIDEAIHVS
jgi:hypothetical protein